MTARRGISVQCTQNRDGRILWVASGMIGGVPYIAEGETEHGAVAEACTLVYQRHALRRIQRKEAMPC